MTVWEARFSAIEPNDTTIVNIKIVFTAETEHDAKETAQQFVADLNRSPFSGFVLDNVTKY